MTKLFLPLALGLSLAAPAIASADEARPVPHITVVGEGETAVTPDLATLSLGVMREAETASEALEADNKAMAAVIADMKAAGVAARDLQTSGLSINPRYSQPKPGQEDEQPRIVAYQATNMLTVRVRDLAKLGEIIDRAVKLGVNQGSGIDFGNDDPTAATAEARRKAVADALRNARTLTEAAGARLGRILEISETGSAPPPRPMLAKAAFRADAVPVEPGETTYHATVTMTFELKQ